MQVKDYLKNRQPILYRTFSNALTRNNVSHAYLLLGEEGVPLFESAKYLAKSLLCDHPSPLADETCTTCLRVDKGDYPDLLILDGENETIKKEMVTDLVSSFQMTSLEKKGVMIYIVHMVENMTVEAINALLKFLEEPTPNTYAILTSRNESKILPTILSRCQLIRMHLIPRFEVNEEAVKLGVPLNDAEMLCFFYNDASLVKEHLESPAYQNAKNALEAYLPSLAKDTSSSRYVLEKEVLPLMSDKPSLRMFFDLLSIVFQDIVKTKVGDETSLTSYAKIIAELANKLPHPESSLQAIMTSRQEIELNLNATLLLSHLHSLICL